MERKIYLMEWLDRECEEPDWALELIPMQTSEPLSQKFSCRVWGHGGAPDRLPI